MSVSYIFAKFNSQKDLVGCSLGVAIGKYRSAVSLVEQLHKGGKESWNSQACFSREKSDTEVVVETRLSK